MDAANSPYTDLRTVTHALAIDRSPLGLAVIGVDGQFVHANPRLAQLAGRHATELDTSVAFHQVIRAEDREVFERRVADVGSGTVAGAVIDVAFAHPNGTLTPVRLHVCLAGSADRPADGYVIQVEDRTSSVVSVARYETIIGASPDPMFIVNDRLNIVWASPAFETQLGATSRFTLVERVHVDDQPKVAEALAALNDGSDAETLEVRVKRVHTGTFDWYEARIRDLRDDPSINGFLVVCRNVHDRRKAEEALRHQALHDPLTGLPNRKLLMDRVATTARRSRRLHQPYTLLFMDLDGFKYVNDTFGHAVGDMLLVKVANRLRGRLRASDTLARLGGDEFVVVASDLDQHRPYVQAAQLCESILAAFSDPFDVEELSLRVGVSIGYVVATGVEAPEAVLQFADIAMYEAKAAGRGRAVLHTSEMNAKARAAFDRHQQT